MREFYSVHVMHLMSLEGVVGFIGAVIRLSIPAASVRRGTFAIVPGGGEGSHRKFTHPSYPGAVTLSGQDGDDAKNKRFIAIP